MRRLGRLLLFGTPARPAADFTGTPTSGNAPLAVAYTYSGTGGPPASYAWDFGDGGTSAIRNPTHTYSAPGLYTVALVATNGGGSSTKTRTGYVTAGILLDQFTTPHVAPITSPRSCEPVGTITFTDTNSTMSLAGGRLVINGTPAGPADGYITGSSARAAGLACIIQGVSATNSGSIGNGNDKFGFVSTNAVNGTEAGSLSFYQNGDLWTFNSAGSNFPLRGAWGGTNFLGDVAVVLRGTGAHLLSRDSGGTWRYLYPLTTGNAGTVYHRFGLSANTYGNFNFDNLSVVNLGAPWTTDNWYTSTGSLAANATFGCNADCVVDVTHTILTGETLDIQVRRASDADCWIVRLTQANTGTANALQLIEKVGGAETPRGTGTITLTNGVSQRVVVTCDGARIVVHWADADAYVNYTTATTQQTTAGGKVTLASTVTAYPRYLGGTAPGLALDAAYPYGNPGTAAVYADNTLAADTIAYNPATRGATGGIYRGYKTLAGAHAAADAGGTVFLRAGTFAETNSNTLNSASCAYLNNKTVIWETQAGEAVNITFAPGNPPMGSASAGDYAAIIYNSATLTIRGKNTTTITGTFDLSTPGDRNVDNDINLLNSGTFSVSGVRFTKWGHAAVKCPSAYTSGFTLERCVIEPYGLTRFDHGMYIHDGPTTGRNTIRYNSISAAFGYGIHGYDNLCNSDIYDNAVFGCGECGVLIGGTGNYVARNTIAYNGFVTAGGFGTAAGLLLWTDTCTGNTFAENVIIGNYNDRDVVASTSMPTASNTVSKNVIKGVVGSPPAAAYNPATDTVTTAALVKFATYPPVVFSDLALQAGSTAIGVGVLGTPYNTPLDAAVTTWPTPKAATTTNAGALA